jgi:hypothetical protein
MQLHLNQMLNGYWEMLPSLSDMPLVPLRIIDPFSPSLVFFLMGSCPIVETIGRPSYIIERKDARC